MRKIVLLIVALIFLLCKDGNAQTKTPKKKDVAVAAIIIDDGGGGGTGGSTCTPPPTPILSVTQPVPGSLTGSITVNSPIGPTIVYSIFTIDDFGDVSGTTTTQNTTFSLPAGQSYIIYATNSATCYSNGVSVTIIPAPPAQVIPTTTAVANASIGFGGSAVSLVATVTPLPTGGTPDGGAVSFFLKDYPSAGSNTPIGSASRGADGRYTLVYNPSSLPAATYRVVATFGGNSTFGGSTANGTLTVVQCSVITSYGGGGIVCPAGTMQFVLIGTSAPGAVTRWYSDAGGTNLVGEGTALYVNPPAYDGGSLVRIFTYYGRIENAAPCSNSALQAVSTTVLYPSIATGVRVFNQFFCSGGSAQLVLDGTQSPEGTIRWYTDAGAVNYVGEGQGLSVSPTVTTTYYGRFEDATRYCPSNSAMFSGTVVVSFPSVATGATATNASICLGQSTQLLLQGTPGTGAVVQWFSDAAATTLIGEGNISVSPTVTATYYGRYDDRSICQTKTALHPVTISLIPDNQPPTLTTTPPVTGTTDAGVCYKVVNLAPPTPADNCAIAAAGVTLSGLPAQNRFPVGTTIVTWSVSDVTGNLTTQTQSIVITDNQLSTLTVTPGVTGTADA
ncbi:MAG: HYR domain-containing protein, partial [Ferruginibacter sp.]|nr:HYR domain-containing protein [Ferruginibacter sp.]